MSGPALISCFCVGSALIALWVAVRFPRLGPQRPLTVGLLVIAATLALRPAAAFFEVVAGVAPYGAVLGLVLVVFPALVAAFWAAALGLRALTDLRPRL